MAKQQAVSAEKDNIKSATVHAAAVAEPHPIFLQPQYILLILGLPILGLTVHQAVLHSKLTALGNRRCPEVNSNQCAEKVVGRRQSVNSSDYQYAERVEAPVATKRVLFEKDQELIVGNTTYHPSFGLFPEGCRWRLVTQSNASGHSYQYWDFDSHDWSDERPDACIPTSYPPPGPSNWSFYRDSPRTEVTCEKSHCMYTNLYYNNGRWYALVDGELYIPSWKFSRNQEIVTLHVQNATDFMKPISYRVVPGDTILFDFIFFIHPTAIGHWWEMLGPLYSILKSANFKRPCDQFILLHLQRQHMLEWVRAMIAVTLGVGLDQELPPVLVQEETDNAWHQITQQLEGFRRDTWYVFERVLIVRDLATGGGRTFLTEQDAKEFRTELYAQYALPPPEPKPHPTPRIITFQRKRANRRIVNEDEFLKLLSHYGELRVVEYNSSSSLYEQLLAMRATTVFVGVHTSNLANAPLLQPGSAVFEIIQRNWMWNGLDTSFKEQTAMMGDIHHYAWRALYRNQTIYVNPRDEAKVGHWLSAQCSSEECVEAHTNVDVVVDIPEFKALLESRLPFVWNGSTVRQAGLAWPGWIDV